MGDHGFVVDGRAVHGFGAGLQRDLDLHLSAETTVTLHEFARLPLFGTASASSEVRKAATAYHARLVELYGVLETLVYNGGVMALAAHQIADSYGHADTLTSDQITAALGEARRAVAADGAAVDPRTGRRL